MLMDEKAIMVLPGRSTKSKEAISVSLQVALTAQRAQADAGVRVRVAICISLLGEGTGSREKNESEGILVAVRLVAGEAVGCEISGGSRPSRALGTPIP